jgi:LysR family transcriptional regulator, glycine cleavage system transcriptional activator
MTSKLPPLNSLRAFASAAKHESFAKAALDLGVTQGAISKQIAVLEDYLGIDLFKRGIRNVKATKAAKTYLISIDSAFDILLKATQKLSKISARETLNISILPSLGNQWLLPKIQDFQTLHPYCKVNIKVGNGAIDFEKSETDIATRIGKKGDFKNLCKEKLMDENLLCVCSPTLLKKHSIKNVKDLVNSDLLIQHSTRPTTWIDYFKSHKIKKMDLKYKISFESFFMICDAAKDGLGFALIPDFLIREEIKNGSLVIAFKYKFKSEYAYYLIHPKQNSALPKIVDFKYWIENNLK